MARLNLTLDDELFGTLDRDARKEKVRVATYARRLLEDALAQRRKAAAGKRWAEAYRADRADTRRLLHDLEPGALEILGNEDD